MHVKISKKIKNNKWSFKFSCVSKFFLPVVMLGLIDQAANGAAA